MVLVVFRNRRQHYRLVTLAPCHHGGSAKTRDPDTAGTSTMTSKAGARSAGKKKQRPNYQPAKLWRSKRYLNTSPLSQMHRQKSNPSTTNNQGNMVTCTCPEPISVTEDWFSRFLSSRNSVIQRNSERQFIELRIKFMNKEYQRDWN